MRVLLKILSVLVAVIAVVFGVIYAMGSRLPVAHVATASVTVPAAREKVWQMIADTASQPTWRTGLKAVEPMPPSNGLSCWREVQSGMKMPLCVESSAPPQVEVVRIADPSLTFGGTWKYELEAVDSAHTKLTITEDGTTGPAIWRFMGHYVMKEDSQIKQYESDLLKAVGGAS